MGQDCKATVVQDLIGQLNKQAEMAEIWEARYIERTAEMEQCMERFKGLILFANSIIPDFADAFNRAKGLINPLKTPAVVTDFFSLCNYIYDELKNLMY